MRIIILIVLIICCTGCSLNIVKENIADSNKVSIDNSIEYDKEYYPIKINNINSRNEEETFQYNRPPRKVVAVWQNSIETLIALGAGDNIIAGIGVPGRDYILPEYRSTYDKIPVTSLETLDLETIMMMEPDFILGWYSTFTSKVLRDTDFWKKRGINTYIAKSSSKTERRQVLQDEYEYILDLGKIFDKNQRAEEIVNNMKSEINFVLSKSKHIDIRPKTILIEFIGKEIAVYGGKTLAGDIVRNLNGEILEPDALHFSLEQLIELDPDVIFVIITETEYGNEKEHINRIRNNNALQSLRCVKSNRIYPIPLYAIYTPGVRLYDGIKTIAHGLYPNIYKEK